MTNESVASLRIIMVKIRLFNFTVRPEYAEARTCLGLTLVNYLMGKQKHLTFTVFTFLYSQPEVKMHSFLRSKDIYLLLTAI